MPVIKDRFPELADAVEEIADRGRMRDASKETVERQLWFASVALADHSPHVTSETFLTTGHERNPIQDSWVLPPPSSERDGASGTIASESGHIEWQRYGTEKKDYPIEASGPGGLWFWTGPPLKWPSSLPPGFVNLPAVEHPGFGPWGGRDFVEVAAEDAEPVLNTLFFDMGDSLAYDPLRDFYAAG